MNYTNNDKNLEPSYLSEHSFNEVSNINYDISEKKLNTLLIRLKIPLKVKIHIINIIDIFKHELQSEQIMSIIYNYQNIIENDNNINQSEKDFLFKLFLTWNTRYRYNINIKL